jgi:hypothetical protein
MHYNVESIVGFFLLLILFTLSLHLNVPYYNKIRQAAYNPFMRLLAISFSVILASYNPVLGILSALIVFFWISDVHLLSRK